MRKIIMLGALLVSVSAFAQDTVVSSKVNANSVSVKIQYDRSARWCELFECNNTDWKTTIKCKLDGRKLTASVSLASSHRKLKSGVEYTNYITSKSFKFKTDELCENGLPDELVVNGTTIY